MQSELIGNVLPNLFGGGRGEGVQIDSLQPLPQLSEQTIFGPELMSPATDTVGLINRDAG